MRTGCRPWAAGPAGRRPGSGRPRAAPPAASRCRSAPARLRSHRAEAGRQRQPSGAAAGQTGNSQHDRAGGSNAGALSRGHAAGCCDAGGACPCWPLRHQATSSTPAGRAPPVQPPVSTTSASNPPALATWSTVSRKAATTTICRVGGCVGGVGVGGVGWVGGQGGGGWG